MLILCFKCAWQESARRKSSSASDCMIVDNHHQAFNLLLQPLTKASSASYIWIEQQLFTYLLAPHLHPTFTPSVNPIPLPLEPQPQTRPLGRERWPHSHPQSPFIPEHPHPPLQHYQCAACCMQEACRANRQGSHANPTSSTVSTPQSTPPLPSTLSPPLPSPLIPLRNAVCACCMQEACCADD